MPVRFALFACLFVVPLSGCLGDGSQGALESEPDSPVAQESFMLPSEDRIYIPCGVSVVVNSFVAGCGLDSLTGQALRTSTVLDRTGVSNASYLLTEMRLDQVKAAGAWRVFQVPAGAVARQMGDYASLFVEGDAARVLLVFDEVASDSEVRGDLAWRNEQPVQTRMFFDGVLSDELGHCCGAGAALELRVALKQTLFVGPPLVDVESYSAF